MTQQVKIPRRVRQTGHLHEEDETGEIGLNGPPAQDSQRPEPNQALIRGISQ